MVLGEFSGFPSPILYPSGAALLVTKSDTPLGDHGAFVCAHPKALVPELGASPRCSCDPAPGFLHPFLVTESLRPVNALASFISPKCHQHNVVACKSLWLKVRGRWQLTLFSETSSRVLDTIFLHSPLKSH